MQGSSALTSEEKENYLLSCETTQVIGSRILKVRPLGRNLGENHFLQILNTIPPLHDKVVEEGGVKPFSFSYKGLKKRLHVQVRETTRRVQEENKDRLVSPLNSSGNINSRSQVEQAVVISAKYVTFGSDKGESPPSRPTRSHT